MIEYCLQLIIKELGPTGLLVIGLYFVLGVPLKKMAFHLKIINHELGQVVRILEGLRDDTHGKT